MSLFKLPLLLFTLLLAQQSLAADKSAINAFIDEMHSKHGVARTHVRQLLNQAEHKQEIIDKMTRRAEKKSWHQYRSIFMTGERIDKGVAFWRNNKALLDKAEREFGVPPEIIVAILGVETLYGERTGKTRVLDALYTLAFGYPKRAKFFRKELMHFILLAKEANFDPAKVTGSYAGAMGASQFISSSYRNYAIDYDNDGRVDLWNSKADIIGSIANYFKRNKWQPGDVVAVKAAGVNGKKHRKLFFSGKKKLLKEVVKPKDKPEHTLADLAKAGIKPSDRISTGSRAYLMPFEVADSSFDYWLGFHNFYVITRYNRSPVYAMAVHQLSQAVIAKYKPNAEKPFAFH